VRRRPKYRCDVVRSHVFNGEQEEMTCSCTPSRNSRRSLWQQAFGRFGAPRQKTKRANRSRPRSCKFDA
jgi:hypothetical protein